jgi:tetratricopeptide (TPR) repeat protein
MLETIREYALERLAARGDGQDVRQRHAAFYLVLAEEAEPCLLGPEQREWLERLDSELDNIRAALTWALDAAEGEIGLRIGAALWRFWQLRNHELEARERLVALLTLGSGTPSTRARAQSMIGSMSFVLGDFETARRVLEESLPVHRQFGDVRMISSTLGLLAVTCGDADTALALSREALEVARNSDDPYVEGHALWHVGISLARVGDLDDAERTVEEAVSFARSHGNLRSVGSWQKTLAGLAIIRGDTDRAWRLFEESLAIHRDLDDVWGVSHSLSNLSYLALEAGDAETAHTLLSEALAIERKSGHQPRLANALEMAARLATGDGKPALAIRLYARATLLGESVRGLTFEVGWPDPTPNLDDLRSLVGEETFEEEWTRGRAMTIIEAIDQAIGPQHRPKPSTP